MGLTPWQWPHGTDPMVIKRVSYDYYIWRANFINMPKIRTYYQ